MGRILWAISDLHCGFRGNEQIIDKITTDNPEDWLIVAGDVSEKIDTVCETLSVLRQRFAKIIWVPGNHELYTTAKDPYQLFGVGRYDYLVTQLRSLGIVTPEDAFEIFDPHIPVDTSRLDVNKTSSAAPVMIVPLFLLYDYSFRPRGWEDLQIYQAIEKAKKRAVMATDEFLISAEPFANKQTWSRLRIEQAEDRLDARDKTFKTILVNHWPLRPEPCHALHHQEFMLWCGSMSTYDWHQKYSAETVVYGHLHIPRTTWYDGVRFEEVSVGYPREWSRRGFAVPFLRQIYPDPGITAADVAPYGVRFRVDSAPEEG